jgi:hypothetical protein
MCRSRLFYRLYKKFRSIDETFENIFLKFRLWRCSNSIVRNTVNKRISRRKTSKLSIYKGFTTTHTSSRQVYKTAVVNTKNDLIKTTHMRILVIYFVGESQCYIQYTLYSIRNYMSLIKLFWFRKRAYMYYM